MLPFLNKQKPKPFHNTETVWVLINISTLFKYNIIFILLCKTITLILKIQLHNLLQIFLHDFKQKLTHISPIILSYFIPILFYNDFINFNLLFIYSRIYWWYTNKVNIKRKEILNIANDRYDTEFKKSIASLCRTKTICYHFRLTFATNLFLIKYITSNMFLIITLCYAATRIHVGLNRHYKY